jgi:hypothetical protein
LTIGRGDVVIRDDERQLPTTAGSRALDIGSVNPNLRLRRVPLDEVDWGPVDALPDRYVSQSREWIDFVAETQRGEPVLAEVCEDGRVVGYFTGLIVRRFGVPILGSPFPGWTTPYMGFNLSEDVPRRAALQALLPFAFSTLGCLHLEVKDRWLTLDDADGLGFDVTRYNTFELDLSRSEEELWARFTSACRRAVRKSEKEGLLVEEATDVEQFGIEYFDQLRDVFAKQSLVPTYDLERVQALIRHLHPTGKLLLLRAIAPDGRCVATGVFPAMNRTAFFWGGAGYRSHLILRPNEAIFWTAMRYWKARGMTVLDLGGGGEYKLKYGVEPVLVPHFRRSRWTALGRLRNWSKKGLELRQALRGRFAR